MIHFIIFTIVVAAIATSAFKVENNATAIVNKDCQISQYVLAIQDMCGYESIHGLWPDPGATCQHCTDEAFDEKKLSSSTLADMKKYWLTCQSSNTNEDFWSHEWTKHGTCTGMTQDEYFSKGLSLFQEYKSKCKKTCDICLTPSFEFMKICQGE